MNLKSPLLMLAVTVFPALIVRPETRVWHNETGYRWATLGVSTRGAAGFHELGPTETGVTFTNRLSEEAIAANRVLANGSGVAVGDYDNDGRPDIYFCGLESGNALYRNLGNWRFQDVTKETGVACDQKFCRGAVFADLNSDGFLDLLVSTLNQGVLCFQNDGQGKFIDQTGVAGTSGVSGSTTLALADVDGNGTLDLYVANYRPDDIRDRGRVNIPLVNGKPAIPAQWQDRLTLREGQLIEYGRPDQLYLNDGTGRFRAVPWTDGTFLDEAGRKLAAAPLDWGLTATFRDVNNDLAPDLYVCNDYWTPDRFWINDGHGHFRAIENLAVRQTSSSSMSVDFSDVDRDGALDFFVVDMLSRDPRLRKRQMFADKPMVTPIGGGDLRPQIMRNTLFRNRGDGTFAEVANYAGVPGSDWSWSPIFTDVDLDGYDDLLISAGHFRDVQDLDATREIQARQHSWTAFKDEAQRQKAYTRELMEHYRLYPPLPMPIMAFRNSRDWTFEETTAQWGLNHLAIHHGMALGDFDQDGDLDIVVNVLNGPAGVFRNDSAAGRLKVRLKGAPPNTQAVGAKVTLLNGAVPNQTCEIISGGRYLSGSETLAVFATSSVKDNLLLEVQWRNGRTSRLRGLEANRVYEFEETSASPSTTQNPPAARAPLANANPERFFSDASAALSHTHHEPEYNDFQRQPLLPFKLSQPGPGLSWFDFDGDGQDDLIIGSGSGGVPTVFRSDGRGNFSRIEPGLAPAETSDFSGLAGWVDESGRRTLLAGVTGYEAASRHAARQFRRADNRFEPGEPIALEMSSGGALALGEMNGDGQLVLFIAGGVVPGRYPLGAPSKIYRRAGGRWELDARNSLLLDNIGIVNGAVWSDLTGDGRPELVLACEWGPIRVFQNRGGLLFEATKDFGLAPYKGWWKGVTTGDFDGDGKMDIVAANWGLNSPYQASEKKPLTFFYGELAQPGVTEIVETEFDPVSAALAPRRGFFALANSLPFLLEQFASHRAYSEATLDQALGQRRPLARSVEATTLMSMVFLNRGPRFAPAPLPREAQLAPAFSVNVADFDGDGREDVFLSQNFFPMQPETPRLDAGRGLWLKGLGNGQFSAVPGKESGIQIYGEQRGAAVADFDEDGRADLAVSQNGAATKLFRNARAKPGLRIRLRGPAGNPSAYGAVLRLISGDIPGPAREIHGGSGYLSQDGSIQILSSSGPAESLWIRWPGGRITTTPIPAAARELTVDSDGKLVSIK